MSTKYVGRKDILEKLRGLEKKTKASIVVVKGRRRVGKSRLVEEFGKDKIFLPFTGLPPREGTGEQAQLNVFAEQLRRHFDLLPHTFLTWGEAFQALEAYLTQSKTVILFDEISWMANKSPDFLGQLKIWWDLNHAKYPRLILVLCGSISSWIEENILKSTGFFGRISLEVYLKPLSLRESVALLTQQKVRGSSYEFYKILSVLGGIPWYLEQMREGEMIDKQLLGLCFQPNGLLVNEFERIFHDLFGRYGETYKKIVSFLRDGMKTQAEIREAMAYSHSGTLSNQLRNLIISGYVSEHYQWNFKNSKIGKQKLYRLSDQYLRFYLKYIEPNLHLIQQGVFNINEFIELSGWDSIMGLQVESLLLQNRETILDSLGIQGQDIVADNPYHQKKNSNVKGCQVDYLIQTRQRNFFVCEFKFSRGGIGREIIHLMEEKLAKFSVPRGFAKIPVLLYLGEVAPSVYEEKYFYRVINIADFIETQ